MNDLFRIPLDFPNAPAIDDEFTASNGATYRWDGTVWVPIGSGQGVYLPLAGGTMEGTLVLDANPINAMEAATKVYVDSIATGARMIIGVIDGTNGRCIYTAASGLPTPSPLVDASTVPSGSDVICVIAGTIPPDPLLPPEVWNMTMAVSDVLVSNGANWILVHVPRAPIIAGQVLTIPAVFGAANVQDALTQAALQDMPPGGAIGQILTKRVGADYDTEWTDASDPVNYTNIFMNRTPNGSGAADPNSFGIGSQSIWMNSNPVNMPPMSAGNTTQGFWQVCTFYAGSTKYQDAIEHTNPSPGPSTILSRWIRPGGNIDTTWGPWVQQSISNTDGAFVRLIGDTMTGPLRISFGNAGETTSNGQIDLIGAAIAFLNIGSQSGGTFRYINRGNNQGGLTFVTNGAPTYVDWLIFNANNNAVSINNLNGNGITIINGTVTVTSDLSANAGSFSGPVTAATPPTDNAHLTNKGYVDQLFSAAPILVGVINAGTGNCQFANATVGPVPAPTGSRHYIICTTPGTIPGGPAAGIVMRLGDEIIDIDNAGTPTWLLIAVGTGGVLATADQVALVPNVAGTNNVQAGMQVLDTNKVAKAGDDMTGALRWASTLGVGPPNAAGNSAGNRLQLWNTAGAPGFGLGIEGGAMWLNTTATNNFVRFYFAANLRYTFGDGGATFTVPATFTSTAFSDQISLNGYNNTTGGSIIWRDSGGRAIARITAACPATGNLDGRLLFNTWNGGYGYQQAFSIETESPPRVQFDGRIIVGVRGGDGIECRSGKLQLIGNSANQISVASESQKYFDFRRGNNTTVRWRITSGNANDDVYELRANTNAGTFDRLYYAERQSWNSWFYGNVSCQSLTQRSDVRLKDDVKPFSAAEAAAAFEHLEPVRYRQKAKPGYPVDVKTVRWGFVADEIEKGAPDTITTDLDGMKGYDVAQVLAITVAKIKQLEDEIAGLKARLH